MSNAVVLTPPPSANRLWRVFRGQVVRSAHYNEWLRLVVPVMQEHLSPVTGLACVSITLYGGKGVTESSDLDNFVKPIMDALKPPSFKELPGGLPPQMTKPGASIIGDDSLQVVHQITMRYQPWLGSKSKREAAYIIVEVTEKSNNGLGGVSPATTEDIGGMGAAIPS